MSGSGKQLAAGTSVASAGASAGAAFFAAADIDTDRTRPGCAARAGGLY